LILKLELDLAVSETISHECELNSSIGDEIIAAVAQGSVLKRNGVVANFFQDDDLDISAFYKSRNSHEAAVESVSGLVVILVAINDETRWFNKRFRLLVPNLHCIVVVWDSNFNSVDVNC